MRDKAKKKALSIGEMLKIYKELDRQGLVEHYDLQSPFKRYRDLKRLNSIYLSYN